ncbi:hypothetical protein GCM10009787_28230 [Streptomyces bangladeshensis]|uniref:Uncharacterized protein n=1 Tax=Streptomyces bangladeshensis TaxID=295352 RepID=A0ABN3BGJ3_9ACTN
MPFRKAGRRARAAEAGRRSRVWSGGPAPILCAPMPTPGPVKDVSGRGQGLADLPQPIEAGGGVRLEGVIDGHLAVLVRAVLRGLTGLSLSDGPAGQVAVGRASRAPRARPRADTPKGHARRGACPSGAVGLSRRR